MNNEGVKEVQRGVYGGNIFPVETCTITSVVRKEVIEETRIGRNKKRSHESGTVSVSKQTMRDRER